ncbi:MAG TPA: 3-methyl-2-oxobutanoate hydroxymethyltransferase [Candidatus Omnitrophica bacterium]|nr:MAG: 3-methyl-2-oxobutanoate hydroxymethyltransferase [Omnitrophica WOR_2 bacterium GWA2_63_20]OGX16108.1 MAG: 3-methyl-2-oxobutanoate hydroxymethyltransferase [Omnitrophica WOR_2 bacterium GWF2_63_9]OGX33390.1 MAG: 3-methyl-2-oxobutanoate hydroxymethyltransferase [Omnitrophica WOR_2 bacterium RIFCSPHIGHO2_12_FULL_64_13]OGX34819.1 MAG: 3-methyl-2-oxobutanoate hydroxymethyltransferase [Omnitrophica WOR_2 bacterium RIFCSPHIGHO2_02_FULL_63_39]OGX45900.1 MAG: 3-methyl-2-oxobutanoate hydroxymethy
MPKVTVEELQRRKPQGGKITMLTAYDYPLGKLVDEAGVDIVLVGDSLGMVVLGYETTTPVTMEEMIHHAKAARRGVANALLIGDMPFLSFRGSLDEALTNARRFIQEAGCDGVKVEWKTGIEHTANAIIDAGIPVMGHVGLTPQTAASEGGFGMRGKDAAAASRIVAQALALEGAGCFAMVVECVPDLVAQEITRRLRIPTIGIGSGPWCDGQVLVTYDLIGLFERFTPRFVKRYAETAAIIRRAAASYVQDVKAGTFPGPEHTVAMPPQEAAKFKLNPQSKIHLMQ